MIVKRAVSHFILRSNKSHLNYYYMAMGLNFKEDFNDSSHLNYQGSCKFTDYLGKELKQMYDIPDRRGMEKWESWDRHAQELRREAEETFAAQ